MKKCTECDATFNGETWTCPSCQHTPSLHDDFLCFAPDISNVSAFDEKSFAELGDSLDHNFWFPPRNRLITWAFLKYFSNTRSFLEVGCAGAYVLKALADANPEMQVTGTDIFTEGLKEAKYRMRDRATFIQTNATKLPYFEEFDVIGAFDVIEHITDDVAALREIHKALKPGGGVMITVPRHMFLWSVADTTAHHKRRYSGSQLREIVNAAGFHILRQLSFGMITLPFQYISRRLLLTESEKASEVIELETNPITRFVLEKLLEIDQIPIKWGVNYPCGASLMVVARKV